MKEKMLSAVQLANLSLLIAIHEAGREDPCHACLSYRLTEEELFAILAMNTGEVLDLVLQVGESSLFLPRPDLPSLISMSRSAIGPLVAARLPAVRGGCLP